MDAKLPKSLDPKLKEAYDRVMSFTPLPSVAPATPPKPVQAKTTTFVPSQTETTSSPEKKQKQISPLILGVLAIVFIAVYLIFWVTLFHVKIPFLPK